MAEFGFKPFSADCHLEMSPERWRSRVPKEHRDRAPRLIKFPDGGDGQLIEGREPYVLGLAVTGKPFSEHRLTGVNYDGEPGTGSPEQRLEEQDQDNIAGEVLFSGVSGPGIWRNIRDDEAYNAVVHAYNEFLAEEYAAVDPNRLICMGVIPNSNIDAAVAELEYCSSAGLKGIQLSNFPSGKGMPTAEDDRFWSLALELDMPLSAHVSFGGRQGPTFAYARRPKAGNFGADPFATLCRFAGDATLNALQLIQGGVFDRFPAMKLYFAETMAGWLPSAFEQLDDTYERSRYWMERDFGLAPFLAPPSHYLKKHISWGFIRDIYGVRVRHDIGIDSLMWGSDFPHSASNWPHSDKIIDEMFVGVPDSEKHQLLDGNVRRYFHLEDE